MTLIATDREPRAEKIQSKIESQRILSEQVIA